MLNLKARIKNLILCIKYPFLQVRNVWTGKRYWGFEYTMLDYLPSGWRKVFAKDFCKDMKNALSKLSWRNRLNFMFYDLKEKYGSLRIYTSFVTKDIDYVINKYEYLSSNTCFSCGAPAQWVTRGYILPYCDNCKNKSNMTDKHFEPIRNN